MFMSSDYLISEAVSGYFLLFPAKVKTLKAGITREKA